VDLKNPVDDLSLCNLCSFPLKLFNDEAETMSSLNVFYLLTILSDNNNIPVLTWLVKVHSSP